jgi:hypothetical protein
MLKNMRTQMISLACIVAASSLQPVFAQTVGSAGTISQVSAGWTSATFGVTTTAPFLNPAGCTSTDMYEVSEANDSGYSTYYAAVLTAYSTGSQIKVVVSNTVCTMTRPTIIGIYII